MNKNGVSLVARKNASNDKSWVEEGGVEEGGEEKGGVEEGGVEEGGVEEGGVEKGRVEEGVSRFYEHFPAFPCADVDPCAHK